MVRRSFHPPIVLATALILVAYSSVLLNAADDDSLERSNSSSPSSFKLIETAPITTSEYFVTVEKRPTISGIRVEDGEDGNGGFVGYSVKLSWNGHCPTGDTSLLCYYWVHVWLFGCWLDDIAAITFTAERNCTHTPLDIGQEDFVIQTESHILVRHEFHPIHKALNYRVCIQAKAREVSDNQGGRTLREMPFQLVEDRRMALSTEVPPRKYYFPKWGQVALVMLLLCLSGLFSGLSLGLMSLSVKDLTIIAKSGSRKEARYAESILSVRRNGNFLLTSLLIGNIFVNSAISILVDNLTSGIVSLVLSSAFIVFFGEIFPQALCVRHGLAIGAHTIWLTRFFLVLTAPFAYPTSLLLDWILGEEITPFDRRRLMEMLKMIGAEKEGLDEEFRIVIGAMELIDKKVEDVMTLIGDAFMLSDKVVLNVRSIMEILRMGFSGEEKMNVVGLLFVRDLALLNPGDNFTVRMLCELYQHPLRFINKGTPLRAVLDEFKKGEYHLCMVQDSKQELVGLVTLEDIFEELIQAEILDESDAFLDNIARKKRHRIQESVAIPRSFFLDHQQQSPSTKALSLTIPGLGEEANEEATMGNFTTETPHPRATDSFPSRPFSQLRLATVQWLATNHPAFHASVIGQTALARMVMECVKQLGRRQMETLLLPLCATRAARDSEGVAMAEYRDACKLYSKGKPSSRFVLVLEGRVIVSQLGKSELVFEGGPWQCFGRELLDLLFHLVDERSRKSLSLTEAELHELRGMRVEFLPDYSAEVNAADGQAVFTYLEITPEDYWKAYVSTLNEPSRNSLRSKLRRANTSSVKPISGEISNSKNEIASVDFVDGVANHIVWNSVAEELDEEELPVTRITSEGWQRFELMPNSAIP